MKSGYNLILIDDDEMSNLLSKLIAFDFDNGMDVLTYTNPELGLSHLISKMDEPEYKSLVLLDIRMPELTGWEVLEQLEPYKEQIRKNFRIFMLSSSIHPDDRARSMENELVTGFIEKPLTKHNFEDINHQLFKRGSFLPD